MSERRHRILRIIVFLLLAAVFGCRQESVIKQDTGPVFFPPPPNEPKLQFLTSFSGQEVSGNTKQSFLETYVLGDISSTPKGTILQPYGLAIHDKKIYVCDVGQNNIKIIDVANQSFEIFPGTRSLQDPVNIFIEPDGTKYVADARGGAVLVYDYANKLIGFLGNQLRIKPADLCVVEDKLYVSDSNNNQVVVLNKRSGEMIRTIGKNMTNQSDTKPDEFALISGLTVDNDNNVYVTDKIKGVVTKFASDGQFVLTYSRLGSLPDCLVRSKGIKLDREKRLWVVDAGPAMAVKVYRNSDGRFLMIFGLPGTEQGQMYMPASIAIDYDNVDLFKKYAVDGAELEFIILVTNQYGPQKVSVYGFGTFPEKYRMQGVSVDDQQVSDNKNTIENLSE